MSLVRVAIVILIIIGVFLIASVDFQNDLNPLTKPTVTQERRQGRPKERTLLEFPTETSTNQT